MTIWTLEKNKRCLISYWKNNIIGRVFENHSVKWDFMQENSNTVYLILSLNFRENLTCFARLKVRHLRYFQTLWKYPLGHHFHGVLNDYNCNFGFVQQRRNLGKNGDNCSLKSHQLHVELTDFRVSHHLAITTFLWAPKFRIC